MMPSRTRPPAARALAAIHTVMLAAAALVAATSAPAFAWPNHPVRLVTLAGAGGGSDAAARVLAEALARRWGQPVVVDNRPGADGIVAVEAFLAARDGHTLLFANLGTVSVNPVLYEKLSYDPARDLVPISFIVEDFIAVAVRPSLPADSLAGLLAAARAKPGTLNYATVPGLPYLVFVALQKATGAEMTFISYRNPVLGALSDLLESRIDVAVLPLATVLGQARAGQIKLLAVTSTRRAPAAPEVPSLLETGYPEFASVAGLGLFAPKAMSPEQRAQIAAAAQAAVADPGVAERLATLGYLPRGTGPEEFTAAIDALSAQAATLARAYGTRPPQ